VEEGADQFLVMEHASGGDLYDWLERGTVTTNFQARFRSIPLSLFFLGGEILRECNCLHSVK
jgi:hypothetical protein